MIITIGRQHGSSGREIARLLAKELGIKCYDKEIVDEAAKHSDFSRELINAYDEKRMSAFLLHAGGYGLNENFRLNMEVVSAQFDAIREIASKEDCIFVGRCADYVLNDRDDVVSVFILGDTDARIKCLEQRQGLDEAQARKKIKEVDAGANVIMCSAMGQQAMVIEAIQAGAKDFIVKPFQAERVLEAVKKVVG